MFVAAKLKKLKDYRAAMAVRENEVVSSIVQCSCPQNPTQQYTHMEPCVSKQSYTQPSAPEQLCTLSSTSSNDSLMLAF